eukprot:4810157-Lingulodinium_polyedra.AAC.1
MRAPQYGGARAQVAKCDARGVAAMERRRRSISAQAAPDQRPTNHVMARALRIIAARMEH